MYENIAECHTINYTKKKNNILIGTIFPLTINMCDRGRTITHLQISRFHTQEWYKWALFLLAQAHMIVLTHGRKCTYM